MNTDNKLISRGPETINFWQESRVHSFFFKWSRSGKWQSSENDIVLFLLLGMASLKIYRSDTYVSKNTASITLGVSVGHSLSKPLQPKDMKPLPTMRMVCQPRQDRSGTWCRDPKIGRGHEVQISEPWGLSVGVIARRPLPPLPQANMWLSRKKETADSLTEYQLPNCSGSRSLRIRARKIFYYVWNKGIPCKPKQLLVLLK